MALKLKDITAGNTRRIDLTFTDESGAAYDITGATIAFVAKLTGSDSAAISINSTANSSQFLTLSASGGQVRVTLTSANTTLTAGTYNFGAQATMSDGTVVEDTGSFKVKAQYVT